MIIDELADGSGLDATTIKQSVIDLDGDNENTEIIVHESLTLNVDAIDDDGTNTFNGKMKVNGVLDVNIPSGWEIDGEFIGDGRHLTGSQVTFDEAIVRFNEGFGFSFFEMDVVFTENARVFIASGVDFLRSNVVIQGGRWTAVGDRRARFVEFSGNVTIDGETNMSLHSVDLGNVSAGQGRLTINQPLFIQTDEVETGLGPVFNGERIEINPDGQLRMNVRDRDFVPWTINRSLLLRGHEDGTFSQHLAGSDVRIVGGVSVTGASAWLPLVEINSGIIVNQNATLRLEGGGTRLGRTNLIVGAEILGPGTLAVGEGNGLAGSGLIETAIAFDEGNSILVAEGGTLTVAGPIESIHSIAAVDGTLELTGPWHAGVVVDVELTNGIIRAGSLPLAGDISVTGDATLDAQDLRFNASSSTNLGGTLTLRGSAAIEAGGDFNGEGVLTLAASSRLIIADGGQVGTIVESHGTVALGNADEPIASVEIAEFHQRGSGTLQIDLAAPGQFDRLSSIESPSLAGTLSVALLSGFQPDPGDSFTIIETDSTIVGQFDVVDLPPLRSGLDWSLEYLPSRVTLLTTGTLTMLPGDYDSSGSVDQGDLDLVLLSWGKPVDEVPPQWTSNPPTGVIDQDELDPVLLNWGSVADAAAASAIPEPASSCIVCIVALALLAAMNRSRGER